MKLSPTASPHLAMPSPAMAPGTGRPVSAPDAPTSAAPAAAALKGGTRTKTAATQGQSDGKGAKGDGKGTPKKRVRLKPETPEQLIERLRNPQLSLHEASILLRVSRATVRRYADSGRLGCQRTPGGQRRFYLRDIENFYRQLKLKR